jgi:hypothetical protein
MMEEAEAASVDPAELCRLDSWYLAVELIETNKTYVKIVFWN